MPLYEHVYLARQDVSAQQVETATKEYTSIIEGAGGSVQRTEYWGVKTLAYKIKKNRKAHYTMMNIDASPEAVAEMERQMGLSSDVIRFMTIRVDAHETEPSVQMRKSDRDERRGGPRGPRRGDGPGGSTFRDRGASGERQERPSHDRQGSDRPAPDRRSAATEEPTAE